MTDISKQTPSLLEPQSQGGDTAETGFDFQTNLILCKIPFWLSFEGFDSLIREGVADFEAKFFSPAKGITLEAFEAKNHHVAQKEFWGEIERFKEMDSGSHGTFGRFAICCSGISDELKPLINGLRRLRDPQPFYEPASGVTANSYADYVERVRKLGKDETYARFLYEKVLIEPYWNLISDEQTAIGLFQEQLLRHLPEYGDLPGRELKKIYPALLALLRFYKARPITRLQIEKTIQSAISDQHRIDTQPIVISTEVEEEIKREKILQFEWASFFGGNNRKYPDAIEWNNKLYSQLLDTSKWIKDHRNTRQIHLKGNRRISAAIAFGYVFSAVSGFSINMDYRGEFWATDNHANTETPDYPIFASYKEGTGAKLIVTIGIMKDQLATEVERFLQGEKMSHLPKLHLFSPNPIISAKQANLAVEKVKREIKVAVGDSGVLRLELFYAGPSHLALFLGHRLNTLPPIQCYEWVADGKYVPTVLLQ